jgi:hypothetical protein
VGFLLTNKFQVITPKIKRIIIMKCCKRKIIITFFYLSFFHISFSSINVSFFRIFSFSLFQYLSLSLVFLCVFVLSLSLLFIFVYVRFFSSEKFSTRDCFSRLCQGKSEDVSQTLNFCHSTNF